MLECPEQPLVVNPLRSDSGNLNNSRPSIWLAAVAMNHFGEAVIGCLIGVESPKALHID